MSQTAIGRAALVLTTNAGGLRSGLDAEGRHARQWADATARNINTRLKPAGKEAASGLGASLGRLAGPAAIAAAGVAGVTAAVGTLGDVAKAGAAANAFGLTAEQFTGMAGVAKSVGEDTREFIESLVTLGKVASEGAAGKGEVATQWFKDIGLNAQAFKNLRLDEQFFQVFEALQKMQDPAARVRALMVAFGEDGGKYLLPLLSKSSGEIRKMADGFKISTEEVQKATAANAAVTAAGGALKSAWRGIAVALAPAITLVAGVITKLQPVFDWLKRAAETYFTIWAAVWGAIIDAVGEAATGIRKWVAEVLGLTGPWPTIQDVITFTFRAIGTAGSLAWDAIKGGAGLVSVALGFMVEKGLAPVVRAFKDLIGLSKHLPDVIRPAWVDGMNAALVKADASITGLGQRMQEWGKSAVTGFGNSALQFNAWLDKVTAKQKAKTEEAAAGAAAAGQKLDAVLTKFDNAALLRGSAAEVSARVKHEFGRQTAAEKLLDEQKRANGHLRGIEASAKILAARPAAAELAPF